MSNRIEQVSIEIEDIFEEYLEIGDTFDEDDLRDVLADLNRTVTELLALVREVLS
jgi:hypothetical protein